MKKPSLIALLCAATYLTAAAAESGLPPIEFDKQLGGDAEAEILANPREYPILPRTGNAAVYDYLEQIKRTILQTGKVVHEKDFVWKIHVLNEPETINAFATPGGYIYVYTGLIH
jgi:predicted Zn-dependent protease